MLRSLFVTSLWLFCVNLFGQTPKLSSSASSAEDLLTKTKALYDTPFQSGLISFSCAVDFDFVSFVKSNFGDNAQTENPVARLLTPIKYRVFVDHSGAIVSAEPQLPDLSKVPFASQLELSNRNLIQTGLSNWVPYAYGEVLPISPTKYNFEKTATGYNLEMNGKGIAGKLVLDQDLHLVSGVIDTAQHIEITTSFVNAPKGLILAASSTNTDHAGVARFAYTYKVIDGFQIPQHIELSSEQNKMTLKYALTDCKTQHGVVVHVAPPSDSVTRQAR